MASNPQYGPMITFSGTFNGTLGILSSYNNGSTGINPYGGSYIGDDLTSGAPWPLFSNPQPFFFPQSSFPPFNIPASTANLPLYTLASTHKGLLYNREAFLAFVEKLTDKVLIFVDNGVEKIVEKHEALKFVFFHFLASKDYKNWDDFRYEDDEWTLFFREAKSSPELLESFNFTYDKIKEALCM
jgi:hypothetical protein